ncbi:helix-turn-helix domain-containing protein [Flectobacillus major]|jgi:AraC-like DNA-binding protein|uniref:helix-turn-helix domain-containing protein n=1 Tax=Flectobacillus major TaxID=103 RepID=UPI0003FE43D5|nr:AraC family transcriptional regulator [Flectobacillus major]
MEIKNLYAPFEMELLEVSNYQAKQHTNTFFEMVFVLNGTGVQLINDHQLAYSSDKLFLIFPQDRHGFEVHQRTSLFFIRFNDSYLQTQSKEWLQKLEFIFHTHNHLPGCILKNVEDKPLIRALVEGLVREYRQDKPQRNEVIQQLINTIITIAARNITLMEVLSGQHYYTKQAVHLLNYVHQNIYDADMLKVEKMADTFHLSPNYLSEYFKKQVGENLQHYIIQYKIQLVATRLRYTSMRISEIAFELGFSDESHLNKIFKKYRGVSPSVFRKKWEE